MGFDVFCLKLWESLNSTQNSLLVVKKLGKPFLYDSLLCILVNMGYL